MSGKSMKGHQPQNSKSVDWLTPRWILDPLGHFDLDPCTPESMPWSTARARYTLRHDGLKSAWWGRVWLNPPFDEASRNGFLKRMAGHGNGIALVPASTETVWFKNWIWPYASSILFLDRRPYFHKPDGTRGKTNSGCSICLVGYGALNDSALAGAGIWRFIPMRRRRAA